MWQIHSLIFIFKRQMIGKFIFSNGKWSAIFYFGTANIGNFLFWNGKYRQIIILKRQISANFYFEIANNWLIFILQVVLDEGRKVAGRKSRKFSTKMFATFNSRYQLVNSFSFRSKNHYIFVPGECFTVYRNCNP